MYHFSWLTKFRASPPVDSLCRCRSNVNEPLLVVTVGADSRPMTQTTNNTM